MAGINDEGQVGMLELNLESLNLKLVRITSASADLAEFHHRIAQESQVKTSEELLQGLANVIKGLIYKKADARGCSCLFLCIEWRPLHSEHLKVNTK